MRTSNRGVELIKKHEKLVLKAYTCPAGKLTIGYGHTGGVNSGDVITKEQAIEHLRADLATAERALNRTGLLLNQNQFDALVSLIFNIGAGAFARSTLLRIAKQNVNDPQIANEFRKWKYGRGFVLAGLVTRREEELKLYFS